MFAGDSHTLRNKCHFIISVIATNMFYCIVDPSQIAIFTLCQFVEHKLSPAATIYADINTFSPG